MANAVWTMMPQMVSTAPIMNAPVQFQQMVLISSGQCAPMGLPYATGLPQYMPQAMMGVPQLQTMQAVPMAMPLDTAQLPVANMLPQPQVGTVPSKASPQGAKDKVVPIRPPVTGNVPQPDMDLSEILPEGHTRDTKYTAVVVRIGDKPVLHIRNVGNFPFAYRNVKKRKGDHRILIAVGNVVECKLTSNTPSKAISVKIVSGTGVPLAKGEKAKVRGNLATKRKASAAAEGSSDDEGHSDGDLSSSSGCVSGGSSLVSAVVPEMPVALPGAKAAKDEDLSWVETLLTL